MAYIFKSHKLTSVSVAHTLSIKTNKKNEMDNLLCNNQRNVIFVLFFFLKISYTTTYNVFVHFGFLVYIKNK